MCMPLCWLAVAGSWRSNASAPSTSSTSYDFIHKASLIKPRSGTKSFSSCNAARWRRGMQWWCFEDAQSKPSHAQTVLLDCCGVALALLVVLLL